MKSLTQNMTKAHALRSTVAAGLILVLAACGGRAATTPAIQDAESAVNRAQGMDAVQDHAPVLLADAKDRLGEAKSMWANGDDQQKVDAKAYVAQRKAESAIAKGKKGAAQAKAEELEDRRSDILISAREREAEAALSEAERQRRQAERERAQAEAARKAAQAAREEAEEAKDALAAAKEELAELKPKVTARGLMLTLPDVLFAVDSAELKPASLSTLDKLASYLRDYPDYQLAVEGHTDSTGSDAYNQGLSERRAASAQAALIERGIDPARMTARGFGESQPVADNSSQSGRALNRRVEIILLN